MMKSKWAGVVSGILIVVALGVLYMRMDRSGQKLVLDLPEYIGMQLAEQAAGLLADGGEVLLIKSEVPGATDPYAAAYQRGFTRALGELAPGARVEEAGVTADPMDLQAGKPIFGAAELSRLVKEHPQSKVFVSLAGMPEVTRRQISGWGDSKPKLIVFAPFGGPVPQLIKAGVIHSAIVPRDDPISEEEEEAFDDSIEARFEQDYTVFSAQ